MLKRYLLIFFSLIAIVLYSFSLENFDMEKREIDFVPQEKFVKGFCGTFDNFVSDLFFLRSVQYIGDTKGYFRKNRLFILENLEVSFGLDPLFLGPVFFGGVVLSQSKDDVDRSIQFLQDAAEKNKSDWQIPYWIGFNYYYMLDNQLEAVKYFKIASSFPNAPRFLTSNQAMLYYKAKEPKLGLEFLEGLRESMKNKDKAGDWIDTKINWLKNIIYLEDKVNEFKTKYGRLPSGLEELAGRRLIDKVPQDPFGKGYYLDKESGRVKSKFFAQTDEGCTTCKEKNRLQNRGAYY